MKWTKTGKTEFNDGGYLIRYELAVDPNYTIVSHRYPIAHANGEGSWLFTEYTGKYPDGTLQRFQLLARAKIELENIIGLERMGCNMIIGYICTITGAAALSWAFIKLVEVMECE